MYCTRTRTKAHKYIHARTHAHTKFSRKRRYLLGCCSHSQTPAGSAQGIGKRSHLHKYTTPIQTHSLQSPATACCSSSAGQLISTIFAMDLGTLSIHRRLVCHCRFLLRVAFSCHIEGRIPPNGHFSLTLAPPALNTASQPHSLDSQVSRHAPSAVSMLCACVVLSLERRLDSLLMLRDSGTRIKIII